jgi:SET domain-containing protein
MTKEELLKQVREDVYCRIAPSPIGGVGVFAIRDIPQDTNPFVGTDEEEYVEIDEHELADLDPEVMRLVHDMFVYEHGTYYFSGKGLQAIDISYFLNHSLSPNMAADELGEEFRTARPIKKGEELLVNYNDYDGNQDEFR